MGIQLKNNASGTLATAINASDTGIVLTTGNGANFPALGTGDYFYATLESTGGTTEVIKVTVRSGDSMTVVRAQEGTSAQSFAAGSRIELRVTAASVNDRVIEAQAYTDTLRSDLAASSGSSLVGFLQAGASAVPRTVQSRLREYVSVKDFGAVGDGVTDDTAAIQAALDYIDSVGGGTVFVPNGVYNIDDEIQVYSNTTFTGQGQSSKLYSTNTTRLNGVAARGTSGTPFVNVHITNLSIVSSSVFTSGLPDTSTGQGVTLVCCEHSSVENCFVSNWSDGGIFGDGCRYSYLTGNFVDQTGQAIGFIAFSRDCYNNIVSNNVVTNTGTYNAIHLEGAFSGSAYKLYFTVVSNNTVRSAYNKGINIEVAEYTTCVGNTVFETGLITDAQLGEAPWVTPPAVTPTYIRANIFLFGAPYSSVTGNTCNDTSDYAVVIAANSDRCVVMGNTSFNTGGGLLISDGYGAAATTDVSVGANNWDTYGVDFQGNVSLSTKTTGLTFQNVNQTLLPSGGTTLGWYEEDTFTPVVSGTTSAGAGTYTAQTGTFTRIGNVVTFTILVGWSAHTGTGDTVITGLPYTANLTSYATSVFNNGFAPTTGEIVQGLVQQNTAQIALSSYSLTTGSATALPIDASVAGFIISGQYQV